MSSISILPEQLALLLIAILLHFSLTTSQPNCLNSETYADNSTYQSNLNTLISSLSFNIGPSGFINASIGQTPDRINAIVLCRGDISLTACRQCINGTAPVLLQRCFNNRAAIFWNETCMVRYSDQPIFGTLQTQPNSLNPSTTRVTDRQDHDRELRQLLQGLREIAAEGGSVRKVAAGNYTGSADLQPIFALEQCTPDLAASDCSECLTRCIDDIPTCCSGIIGAGILRPSCTLRFENYRFFNPSMPQVTPELVPSGNKSNHTGIIVGVSVSAFVILVVLVGILYWKRIKGKPNKELVASDDISSEGITTAESLQYDFGKIKAATNDFAETNKLGQGGFGAVYKGRLQSGQEIAVKRLLGIQGKGMRNSRMRSCWWPGFNIEIWLDFWVSLLKEQKGF